MAEKYNISIETQAKLEEIQHLLEELRDINAEIAKINGQTFSAINSSAATFTQTVNNLADAVRNQGNAAEEAKKSSEKLSTGLDNAKNSTKSFSKEIGDSKTIVDGFNLELGALGARLATQIPKAFTATISAFGRQEVALQKLTVAVRSNGGSVAELMPIMRELASEMQKITVHGDEQVLEMQSLASAMGVNSEQMRTVMETAIGLSEALGMDLASATKAASAAVQGKTELLQRYIPTLDQCSTEEAKLAKVQELARSGFDQAKNRVTTLDGALKQAANAWGDLQEVVGSYFAPTVRAVAGLIKGLSEFLSEHTILTKALTSAVTGLAVSFAFAKVGGLINVSRMLLGVASATKTATGAMLAFNAATKANPIGLIVGIAAAAVTALMALNDWILKTGDAENEELEAFEKRVAAEKEAAKILSDYQARQSKNNESTLESAERAKVLAVQIERLNAAYELASGEARVEIANKLVSAQEEYAKIQEKLLEYWRSGSAFQTLTAEKERERLKIEWELNEAKKKGSELEIKAKESELESLAALTRKYELAKKYFEAHKHEIKNEFDANDLYLEADAFAQSQLDAEKLLADEKKRTADIERETGEYLEKTKEAQKAAEMDILRARASGNETLAKEKEAELKISKIALEIFENTRKEGMSRKELESLQETARAQAEERFNLEKSVTDEIQRQNLAKNAQAKIEDILLTNKIEQLKAEGKITAAKELEREREIKRTLAGLQGVSEKDKEALGKKMRQTNTYRDRQDAAQTSSSGTRGGAGGRSGGGFSGGDYASGTGRGATPPKKPRTPVTVSDKNLDLYNEWKDAGGEKGTGKQWMDFRDSRNAPRRKAPRGNARMQAQARGFLDSAANQASSMAGLTVGGGLQEAAALSSSKQMPPSQNPSAPAKPEAPKPAAASAINKKLESMGADTKSEKNEATAQINDSLKAIQDLLKSIKSTISSSAEKK